MSSKPWLRWCSTRQKQAHGSRTSGPARAGSTGRQRPHPLNLHGFRRRGRYLQVSRAQGGFGTTAHRAI
eukprot:scaffold42872_cov61-Phaeocystis_antarctica.AAC.1